MGKPTTSKKVSRVQVQRIKTEDSFLRDVDGSLLYGKTWVDRLARIVNMHGAPSPRMKKTH